MEWIFYVIAWYASGYIILWILMNCYLQKNDYRPYGKRIDYTVNAVCAVAGPVVVPLWYISEIVSYLLRAKNRGD